MYINVLSVPQSVLYVLPGKFILKRESPALSPALVRRIFHLLSIFWKVLFASWLRLLMYRTIRETRIKARIKRAFMYLKHIHIIIYTPRF